MRRWVFHALLPPTERWLAPANSPRVTWRPGYGLAKRKMSPMMLKILLADKLAPEGAEFLRSQNDVEVNVKTGLSGDDLVAALAAHDGVVVRSETQITRPILEKSMSNGASRLKGIGRAGVGVDNIDLDAATS